MVAQVGVEVATNPKLLAIPVLMAALVSALLWTVEAPLDRNVVLAATPWMVVGAAVHVLSTVGAYDPWAGVFFGPTSVYFTTYTAAGMVLALMSILAAVGGNEDRAAQYLLSAGTGTALVTGGVVLGRAEGGASVAAPAFGGLLAAVVVGALAYLVLNFVYPKAIIHSGLLGYVVVFAHAFDGIMTAISVQLLGNRPGYGLGRRILSVGQSLPTADLVGPGWLVVAVKLLFAFVALSVVGYLLSREELDGREVAGYVVLGVVGAYGLGPGMSHFFEVLIGA